MKCYRCDLELEGDLIRCTCEVCHGVEGIITKDGSKLVARVYGDSACHPTPEDCIAALKHRIMALEAHT
jgi:hypothetical protein